MLKRLLAYADKVFSLRDALAQVRDTRQYPQIATALVVRSLLVMLLGRVGSLNGLAQVRPAPWLKRWLGGTPPSADTLGRVAAGVSPEDVRRLLQHHYARRRRNKGLPSPPEGLRPVIFDGHEANASYRRCCPECLPRTVHTAQGERTQYYHRYVAALLALPPAYLLLDVERQKPGEDEMACARRLLERLLSVYPRAFDVVCGDNLYMNPDFCRLALEHGKDFIAVLKNENRNLLQDARSLFEGREPQEGRREKTACRWWDLEGFTSWETLKAPVRVVRSVETRTVHRQRTGEDERIESEWVWVTSLPRARAGTALVVRLGHGRWAIENQGFNELVNAWHADHVYKHEANALLVFWLLTGLAYNLFHALLAGNLKPVYRRAHTALHFARCVQAQLYAHAYAGP